MIKSKKCSLCDKPAFSKGFCQQHGKKSTIKSKTIKTSEKKEIKSELRNIYFEYHIERCTHSEESSKPINEPTRTNVAHIIDKGRHPSLQDHLDNYVYLTFHEHERFDSLLFSLRFADLEKEFKNSWQLACIRGKDLLLLCRESTNFTREFKKYLDGREEIES
jgi:hypothetical protein